MAGFTVGGDRVDCRAWLSYKGTDTVSILDDYGVSSVTDNGTGDYSINFDFTWGNAEYVAAGIGGNDNGFVAMRNYVAHGPSSTVLRLAHVRYNGGGKSDDHIFVICAGN